LTNQYTLPVPIRYAGAAPLEVEGVGQINFVLPAPPTGALSGPFFQVVMTSLHPSPVSLPFQIWIR
jgi:hypothetical protein